MTPRSVLLQRQNELLPVLVRSQVGPKLIQKVGYVDQTGKLIGPPQFAQARPFNKGLAAVAIATKACLRA
jgi:hypothetical protein